MTEHLITSDLKTMIRKYDYVTICDNFRFITVPITDDNQRVQRQIELVNPRDYTKQEIIDNYDLKTRVIKWIDSYTEDGHESMLVVLKNEEE